MKETIIKINKTKSWFFEKIKKKTGQTLSQTNKKRERERRFKSAKLEIKKERLQQTMQKIQRIVRDYYEQLYGNKLDNLEEKDRFLEKFNLPRLNQEEIEIMNNLITSTEIEPVIKKISQKTKAQDQMASQENFI